MVAFEGYFDESGDFDSGPKIFCISGYFIDSEQAKLMDAEWAAMLREHDIPYFHMVDCAHGTGVFASKTKEERIAIETRCIGIIKKYTLTGFSALAQADFFETSDKFPDIYSSCVDLCITGLFSFLDIYRLNVADIAYFFETGHKNKGDAYKHVAKQLEKLSASLTFAPKEKVRLLQAADLLAWQSAKYVKDRMLATRPPRHSGYLSCDLRCCWPGCVGD